MKARPRGRAFSLFGTTRNRIREQDTAAQKDRPISTREETSAQAPARALVDQESVRPSRLDSMMPEQRQQNDDRQRHAEKPKKNSASETHGCFLSPAGLKTTRPSMASPSSCCSSVADLHSFDCCDLRVSFLCSLLEWSLKRQINVDAEVEFQSRERAPLCRCEPMPMQKATNAKVSRARTGGTRVGTIWPFV
jgi:hypothetical protein